MLDDLLREGLRLVICGTAAGTQSATLGHYYAGPGNKLWRTLFELGLTPRQLAPSEAELLPDFGIGLTDLVKGQSGADAVIDFGGAGPQSLRKKVLDFQPGVLCFNGKRAAQEYFGTRAIAFGERHQRIGATVLMLESPATLTLETLAGRGERPGRRLCFS